MDKANPNLGTPRTLFSYYVERDGKKEIRTINDYHMNTFYGGQSELEAFLRARCKTIEFLGKIRFICNLSEGVGTFLTEEPGGAELFNRIKSLRIHGAKITMFFDEGTNWLDEKRQLENGKQK
jgi:hypothetical protein